MPPLDLENKKVLVTGGAGAIGSNLVERLIEKYGARVSVIDDLSQGKTSNLQPWIKKGSLSFFRGDVNDDRILDKVFSKGLDLVYHLAASFANELSVENPHNDLRCNIRGTLNLLLRSAKAKVKLFVYASSSSIYGPRKEILLKESFFPNPSTPYAVSKLTGEFYCRSMEHLYHLNTVSLRFSNTYGPRDYPGRYRNVIPNFMKYALKNMPLRITGTGNEMRDYTYIDDCVNGIIQASISPKAVNQVFNLGTGKATKTMDLAKAILKITGSKSKIVFSPPRYFDHIEKRMMDVGKARKVFGYNPRTKLEEGLRKTYEWFVRNAR